MEEQAEEEEVGAERVGEHPFHSMDEAEHQKVDMGNTGRGFSAGLLQHLFCT